MRLSALQSGPCRDLQKCSAPGATPYAIPIFNGRSVVVEGELPLSEDDWNQFMTVLSAMKPALVEHQARIEASVYGGWHVGFGVPLVEQRLS